jgi:hypothetical protein
MDKNKQMWRMIDTSRRFMYSYEFLIESRLSPKYFSRERSIGFQDVIMCMLNNFKKSTQIEVDDYFENVKKRDTSVSKQAFSKARQKVSPRAFTLLNDCLVESIYGEDDYDKFKGYRLFAVDGFYLTLNNTEEMRKSFGFVDNKQACSALAQASSLYDIENDIVVHSLIDRYETDERKMALQHIRKLESIGLDNDLILFDRGYPSKELIGDLTEKGIKYLMRVSSQFVKEINEFQGTDGIVEIKCDDKKIKVRVIKVILANGEVEKLISNVLESSLTEEDFKSLYFKRWGIETKYNELKNKYQIENFSGHTKQTVEQDFYATIYLSNLSALAKGSAEQELMKKNSGKETELTYKINNNSLIAGLKNNLIMMILEDDPSKRVEIYDNIALKIMKNPVPVRPNRQFERKKKGKSHKFPMNGKSGL